jgi:hypothetical protein
MCAPHQLRGLRLCSIRAYKVSCTLHAPCLTHEVSYLCCLHKHCTHGLPGPEIPYLTLALVCRCNPRSSAFALVHHSSDTLKHQDKTVIIVVQLVVKLLRTLQFSFRLSPPFLDSTRALGSQSLYFPRVGQSD